MNHLSLRSYQNESSCHSHEYAQVVLPVRGTLELEIEGQGGLVDQNHLAFIAPGNKHCFSGSEQNLFVVADIPERWFKINKLQVFTPVTDTLKSFVAFARTCLENEALVDNTLICQLLLSMLSAGSLKTHSCVAFVKSYIEKQLTSPVNLTKLTMHCHLSKSQLQRHFREATGLAIGEYWRMRKLEYGKLLLSQTTMTIEQIAHALGYSNLTAFSRRFHNHFAMSPSQCRKMLQTANNMRLKDNTEDEVP
ncbi:AraC family transcriptional regulator [Legionella jordanis]|uniref:helix-turn-helix domain-containing protein n=1 Tax=Legionella jordanis TaxID=456 RepID=UPI000EFF3CB6|nr:AraC family transcriptional regulator [Legionella jordanis]RMX21088.1 AraC family transcriptional regulator [Legionella jordanis]